MRARFFAASTVLLQCCLLIQARCLTPVPDVLDARGLLEARDPDDNTPITSKCSAPVSEPILKTAPNTISVLKHHARHIDETLWRRDGFPGSRSLLERRMTLPDGIDKPSMSKFMRNEVRDAAPVVWQSRGSDQNTALYNAFGGNAISAGMEDLIGCTSVVIVSRLGWYVTHYWESITFAPDAMWGFTSAAQALQTTVLDQLTNGAATGRRPAHRSLTGVAQTFNDDSVRAFVIKPSRGWQENRDGYPAAWDAIRQTIGTIIPRLNPNTNGDRWKEITYRRLDKDNTALDDTAAGKVLVKFDPAHPGPTGQHNKLTLWVEWDQIYNDQW